MIREMKRVRRLTIPIVLGLLLLWGGPVSAVSAEQASAANVAIHANGKLVKLSEPAAIAQGRIYVPAADIADMFGAQASWDADNEELTVHTALNDTIVFGNGVPTVYFNKERYRMEERPFIRDGRLYAPLRQLADALHAEARMSDAADAVDIVTVQPAVIDEANGLDAVAAEAGAGKAQLLKRNGLADETKLQEGTKLKTVIPSFFDRPAEPYTEADLTLLAKITMVEAGSESYEGQLALANVILNRVKNAKFPNTIRDVIYAGKQFPPAHNGLLDKSKPHETALRAAKDAMNGKNNIADAVYFFNPDIAKGSFWSSLDVIDTIGHHSFAK